ncbi:MAG: CMP deaminase [Nanoarchaeota archaeon]|nr:CMP deaminase [Nanoarchaeota archaeon]
MAEINIPSWDDYFITMVYLVAAKSKDKRTHVGAVVVGPRREIRSTGYNSFPRGICDDVLERQEKGEKDFWFSHAERNAIYNATLIGSSLLDCILYTNVVPCMPCAHGIVQSGIKEVVVDAKWGNGDLNSDELVGRYRRTFELFGEGGISFRRHVPNYVPLERMNDGVRTRLM